MSLQSDVATDLAVSSPAFGKERSDYVSNRLFAIGWADHFDSSSTTLAATPTTESIHPGPSLAGPKCPAIEPRVTAPPNSSRLFSFPASGLRFPTADLRSLTADFQLLRFPAADL
jgi:hypothetical protein